MPEPCETITSSDEGNFIGLNRLAVPVQESGASAFDRYPGIFSIIRQLGLPPGNSLLSFGCSTGEEIHSIDQMYVEGMRLTGYDVRKEAIDTARAAHPAQRNVINFTSDVAELRPNSYAVVLALSVLCRWPYSRKLEDLSDVFSFHDFSVLVSQLGGLVEPGGYLVINNANYYFEDTWTHKKKFRPAFPEFSSIGFVNRFDEDSKVCRSKRASLVFFKKERA